MDFFTGFFSRALAGNSAYPQVINKSSNNMSSFSSSASGKGPTIYQVRPEPLPPGWEELKDATGLVYYGNPASKSVQWERPLAQPAPNNKSLNIPTSSTQNTTPPSSTPNTTPSTASAPPLPPGWEELKDDGRVFYKNRFTDAVKSDRPTRPLPPEWVELTDNNGNVFYINQTSNLKSFNRPVRARYSTDYYYKVGNDPYKVANTLLANAIDSICPNDDSCRIDMVRVDDADTRESIKNYNNRIEQNNQPNYQPNYLNGGSKNKKKHGCRTKRRRKASRRKASRRTGKK
jgi:hypothetical protein